MGFLIFFPAVLLDDYCMLLVSKNPYSGIRATSIFDRNWFAHCVLVEKGFMENKFFLGFWYKDLFFFKKSKNRHEKMAVDRRPIANGSPTAPLQRRGWTVATTWPSRS